MSKFQIKSRWSDAVVFECELSVGDDISFRIRLGMAVKEAAEANADLRDAVLRGADLSRAVLRGADMRGADMRDADLGGADLRGSDLSRANLRRADWIPRIENIHRKVYAAASAEGALNMHSWHGAGGFCGTTHCRAGWVCHLAGEGGRVLDGAYAMTAPTTETLAGLLAMQQPGTFKYERNQSYDSHKGSPIQGHVIRYIPHPKDFGDGRKSYGFNFPALVASELLGEPEEFMRSVADQLNACPTLAAEVLDLRDENAALRARVAELEGALFDARKGMQTVKEMVMRGNQRNTIMGMCESEQVKIDPLLPRAALNPTEGE